MTNSESVYDNRLMACKIFAERNATYRWIDGMKLIVLTTIPYILPSCMDLDEMSKDVE